VIDVDVMQPSVRRRRDVIIRLPRRNAKRWRLILVAGVLSLPSCGGEIATSTGSEPTASRDAQPLDGRVGDGGAAGSMEASVPIDAHRPLADASPLGLDASSLLDAESTDALADSSADPITPCLGAGNLFKATITGGFGPAPDGDYVLAGSPGAWTADYSPPDAVQVRASNSPAWLLGLLNSQPGGLGPGTYPFTEATWTLAAPTVSGYACPHQVSGIYSIESFDLTTDDTLIDMTVSFDVECDPGQRMVGCVSYVK
jgi:hypothetical protein